MAKQTYSSGQTLTAAQMTTLQTNDYNMTVTTGTANYTLVAGDVGQRRVQNMASAGTVTVPNATFAAGDALWIHSIGAGTQSIVAGAGLTLNSSAGSAPTLAQWEGGVVYFTSSSSAIFFRGGGTTYGVATGGTSSSITVGSQNYTLLTFTSSGTLTVTKAGLFDVLCVGGGGSGGLRTTTNVGSGGGGGGAVIQQTIYLDANATVTVGAKGAAQTASDISGNRGTFSRVDQVCAGGGGGGRAEGDVRAADGAGCGGGGYGTISGTAGGSALISVGANNGGNGGFTTNAAGGGGGGSTAVGSNNSGNTAGNGGTGTDVSTFKAGSALYHGAGGGGGSVSGTGGTAGNSTGGNGGSSGAQGSNATATNYGCGGGGGAATQGGAGADGVVYVRFKV